MATYETAEDQFIKVGDLAFAYRKIGRAEGVPLLLIPGFRLTMDHWDPLLVNGLAVRRTVFLVDNAGVGRSEGDVPDSFAGWANHYLSVLNALGVRRADLLGYSMGGCVAQLMALTAPSLARRLILCGTTASSGPGVIPAPDGRPFKQIRAAATEEEHKKAFMECFFVKGSERSRKAGEAAWGRIVGSRPGKGRRDHVEAEQSTRQARAFARFMSPGKEAEGSFERLEELKLPVLVAGGCEDLLLPTENSILVWRKLSYADARLHLFPDAGHGFLYQYAEEFARLVDDFLGGDEGTKSRL